MAEMPPDYPVRLLCSGRAIDPHFEPTEELYFRIPPLAEWEEQIDKEVPAEKIQSVPFSVNRQKYSRPNDVLFGYPPECGMAKIRVQDIPQVIVSEQLGGQIFEFRVEHVPVNDDMLDNYAHAEVRPYKDGELTHHKDMPKDVKVAFRNIVAPRAKLMKQPDYKQD